MTGLRHEVVFAPAGSGKTERLTSRYIEILEVGVPPERILTLTFTEKAAAEMKERIFKRLSEQNPELGRRLRLDALKLRISTIHSFCLTLVRRFALSLGLDPRIDVLANANELWRTAKYDTLMTIAETGRDSEAFNLLLELITQEQYIGWGKLSKLFDAFFERRTNIARGTVEPVSRDLLAHLAAELRADPLTARLVDKDVILPAEFRPAAVRAAVEALDSQSKLFLTGNGEPRRPRGKHREAEKDWNTRVATYLGLLQADSCTAEFIRSFELFRQWFLATYQAAKRDSGRVDYDDMEYLALQLLEKEPDWQNVLRAFDEHTDHLLVDEFQDTSYLQWGIIDKLTEEWRSGEGAKSDRGVESTVFLVGDEKQSIYLFRGAKVEVFAKAAARLEEWLGPDRVDRITVEDNYRSLQSIIDFDNILFSRLMVPAPDDTQPWQTRYTPFCRKRRNSSPGVVEIIIAPGVGNTAERREAGARAIARRIHTLVDPASPFHVFEGNPDKTETARSCRYSDISVLFRSRSSLPSIENALRDAGIPFIVSGGTGFYDEPEVRYLIALVSALVDPFDSLALYATLRGPIFNVAERDIFLANTGEAPSLLERCRASAEPATPLAEAIAALDRWRALVPVRPLAQILESALAESRVWQTFWEPQRLANLRKLLALIEDRTSDGDSPLRILHALQNTEHDEAKADVRPSGRNAVQLMTIHAAKGLQFPVVFLAGLDDGLRPLTNPSGNELVIEETGPDVVRVSWLPRPHLRRTSEFHMTHVKKELEEEKRLFYVACTRARDGLFLVGALGDERRRWYIEKTRLGWLVEHLGLVPSEFRFEPDLGIPGVRCVNADAIPEAAVRPATPAAPRYRAMQPAVDHPPPRLRAITRNMRFDLTRNSDDDIGMGDAIHRLLEMLSLGLLTPTELVIDEPSARPACLSRAIRDLPSGLATRALENVRHLVAEPSVWSIVAPRDGAQTELPVMYTDGVTVWTGRIDRVIIKDDEVEVYDYKTFAVTETDIPSLVEEYHANQLAHYARACQHIYPGRRITTYLVFTAIPQIVKTTTLEPL